MTRETFGSGGRCPRCGKGPMVTDSTTGEMFCGGCGFVLTERVEESGPEWRSFSKEEHEDRSRTGTPTSLAMHDMGLVRGRSIPGLVAAALYAACRDTETPRTLTDVANGINIKRKDVARCYRLLLRELDLKMPVVDPIKCVARIASKAGLSEKTKRKALLILKDAAEIEISAGKDPMGLAAAALYLSCVMNGENKTQKDVAQAAGVTEVSIRNRYKGLKESLKL